MSPRALLLKVVSVVLDAEGVFGRGRNGDVRQGDFGKGTVVGHVHNTERAWVEVSHGQT